MAKDSEARLAEIEALCESVPWGADETELLSVVHRIADIARCESATPESSSIVRLTGFQTQLDAARREKRNG